MPNTRSQNQPLTPPGSDTLLGARRKIFHVRASAADSHNATLTSNPYVQQPAVLPNVQPQPPITAPTNYNFDGLYDQLLNQLANWTLNNSTNPRALIGASVAATATAAIQAAAPAAVPLLITAPAVPATTGALSLIGGGAAAVTTTAATIGTGTLLLSGAGILAAAAVGGYYAYNYLWGDDNSKALQTTNQPDLEAEAKQEARKIAIQERKIQFKVKKAASEARQLREARRKEVLELREERAKLNANYAQSARQARKLRKARKQEVRAMRAKFKLAKSTTPAVSPSLTAVLRMTESTYRETFKSAIEAREAMEAKRKAAEQAAKIAAEAEQARLAEVARLAAEAEKAREAAKPKCSAAGLMTGTCTI